MYYIGTLLIQVLGLDLWGGGFGGDGVVRGVKGKSTLYVGSLKVYSWEEKGDFAMEKILAFSPRFWKFLYR